MTEREIIDLLIAERHVQRLRQLDVVEKTRRNGVYMMHTSNLSMYERGLSMPGLDKAVIWADALGMEIIVRKKRRKKNGEAAQG